VTGRRELGLERMVGLCGGERAGPKGEREREAGRLLGSALFFSFSFPFLHSTIQTNLFEFKQI
jgi:hypothetical protein